MGNRKRGKDIGLRASLVRGFAALSRACDVDRSLIYARNGLEPKEYTFERVESDLQTIGVHIQEVMHRLESYRREAVGDGRQEEIDYSAIASKLALLAGRLGVEGGIHLHAREIIWGGKKGYSVWDIAEDVDLLGGQISARDHEVECLERELSESGEIVDKLQREKPKEISFYEGRIAELEAENEKLRDMYMRDTEVEEVMDLGSKGNLIKAKFGG